MGSRWINEDAWRRALSMKREQLAEMERPGSVLLHHWKPDEVYTRKQIAAVRRSVERVRSAGLPEWQERYDA